MLNLRLSSGSALFIGALIAIALGFLSIGLAIAGIIIVLGFYFTTRATVHLIKTGEVWAPRWNTYISRKDYPFSYWILMIQLFLGILLLIVTPAIVIVVGLISILA